MTLASLYFRTAAVIALLSSAVGMGMGTAQDFPLSLANVCIALLACVSSLLYGAFYALVPAAAQGALPRFHCCISLAGSLAVAFGIAAVAASHPAFTPFAAAGRFIVYAGLLVFAVIVFRARFKPAEITQ
jgi:hypothetical protein